MASKRLFMTMSEELYEQFEANRNLLGMAYTLLDQENYSNGLNQRKGIQATLEKTIKHTFYQNEADATKYYSNMVNRKQEFGGKFNEKFLEHIETSPDELDTENEE